MLLISSIIFITLALIFYSIGVWAERISRYLKPWHIICFWTGFIFDVSGTIATQSISDGKFNIFHTLTGQIALWMMLIHAIWATWVARGGDGNTLQNFHKYSVIVWLIWMVPYIGGIHIGMSH